MSLKTVKEVTFQPSDIYPTGHKEGWNTFEIEIEAWLDISRVWTSLSLVRFRNVEITAGVCPLYELDPRLLGKARVGYVWDLVGTDSSNFWDGLEFRLMAVEERWIRQAGGIEFTMGDEEEALAVRRVVKKTVKQSWRDRCRRVEVGASGGYVSLSLISSRSGGTFSLNSFYSFFVPEFSDNRFVSDLFNVLCLSSRRVSASFFFADAEFFVGSSPLNKTRYMEPVTLGWAPLDYRQTTKLSLKGC